MADPDTARRFETLVLPHMNSAFNVARWLTHNDQDAQDVVQEAYLRAFRFFGGFRGDDAGATPHIYQRQGYHLAHWSAAGKNYWAITDAGDMELNGFISDLRAHSAS